MAHVYSVETPENLRLSFVRAGLATRAAALCVDFAVMGALLQGSVWLLSSLELFASSAASALWIVSGFVVQWGYGALSEWRFGGRTLGKRLFGIVVIDAAGLRISFSQAALRNLLRLADLLPGVHLLGALVSLGDEQGRRLGDLAARTLVVRDAPNLSGAQARLQGSAVARAGNEAVRCARQLDAAERRALSGLCENLERLALAERLSLCRALVAHLGTRYGLVLPEPMSAETFLRRVFQALRESR
ncbi:MAG TPA: RDD family protein [Polyangiales bacterium]